MNTKDVMRELIDLQKFSQCVVCNGVPSNILISKCEHIFCESCKDALFTKRIARCPKCKTNLSRRMFAINSTVKNLINATKKFNMLTDGIENQLIILGKDTAQLDVSSHFVVNHSDIEKYIESNLKDIQVNAEEDKSYTKLIKKHIVENDNSAQDEFISVSQVPTVVHSKFPSPPKVTATKLKTVDKVKSWLENHTINFSNPTESQKDYVHEIDQFVCKITQPSISQHKVYVVSQKGSSQNAGTSSLSKLQSSNTESESFEQITHKIDPDIDDKISKIHQKCEVILSDCFTSNKANDKQNEVLNCLNDGGFNSNIFGESELESKTDANANVSEDFENRIKLLLQKAPSSDLFSKSDIDNSPKCNQDQKQQSTSHKKLLVKQRSVLSTSCKTLNSTSKSRIIRKTFSLDANTEDLRNINNDHKDNTQDMLRSIFEKRFVTTQSSTNAANQELNKQKRMSKQLCSFIKVGKLGPRINKHSKYTKKNVIFLWKGHLSSKKLTHKDVSIQCQTGSEILSMEYQTKQKNKLLNVAVQTSPKLLQYDSTSYVSESEIEKDVNNGIGKMSPEITLVQNISDVDVTMIPNYNYKNMDKNTVNRYQCKLSQLVGNAISNHCENNKGIDVRSSKEPNTKSKRGTGKTSLPGRPAKSFKRIRSASVSSESDSDFQSCVQPIRELPEENLTMDDLTVKFVSMHESENSNTNVVQKRKVQRLTTSGDSSLKENEAFNMHVNSEDSEPLNYDEILSTVFANIDAELDNPTKQNQICHDKRETAKSFVKNDCLSNITNKPINNSSKSPLNRNQTKLTDNILPKSVGVNNLGINKLGTLASSTPICSGKQMIKEFGTSSKVLDISMDTFNKTSDIDRIIGAIESDFMQKELDTQNRVEISFNEQDLSKTLQRDKSFSKLDLDSENEVRKTPTLACRPQVQKAKRSSSRSKRSLIFNDHVSEKKQTIIEKQLDSEANKSLLNETISTIIDCPKLLPDARQSEQGILSDMELCSPAHVGVHKAMSENLLSKSDMISNTEKLSAALPDTERLSMMMPDSKDMDIMDFVPNSMEVKEFCIACSCLTQEEIQQVKSFANQFNLRFVTQYEDSVTHLVVRVNKDNCCERSLKFINAMVAGAWVVNKNWISDCLTSRTLLPEHKYEALDVSTEPGPRRNRDGTRGLLFNGLWITVVGPFNSTTTDEFKKLLVKSGVRLATTNNVAATGLIVIDEGEHTEDNIRDMYAKYRIPVVDMIWCLDCICRGRITSLVDHILLPDISEVDLQKYPREFFQETQQC